MITTAWNKGLHSVKSRSHSYGCRDTGLPLYGEHTVTCTDSPFSMRPRCKALLYQVWTLVGEFSAGKILEKKVSTLGIPPP